MSEFKIPQISTLAGSTIRNFIHVLKSGKVAPQFRFKIFLTSIIVLIASPFHWWEKYIFNRKIKKLTFDKEPLFIIGHWRSGTTLLHNVLCKDPMSGYLTTYHSLFPNNLTSKWIFKTFMRLNMPQKRPSDNVELDINFPQEDEFALGNSNENSYYNFFYFPDKHRTYYERSVHHVGLSKKQRSQWRKDYDLLIKKANYNTSGKRVVVKNPVNTARVKKILEIYPKAKFLYIYRNPITVFLSTQRFFQKLFPTLWLMPTDHASIDKMIFEVYLMLMNDYQEQKSLIPKNNLMELRFEDFEKKPVDEIKKVYQQLLQEDFEKAKPYFTSYVESIAGYKKNNYKVDKAKVDMILKKWRKFMELYNYDIPEELEMITNS